MTAEPATAPVLRDAALAELAAWEAPDDRQDDLRRGYLDHVRRHPDGVWRAHPGRHLTASAAVLDHTRERVLLTLHPKIGRWVQLGGHCEPGDDSLAAAALREATEESGIHGLRLLAGPVSLDRHLVRCGGGAAEHLDVQYVALAPAGAQARISSESLDLRWFALGELPEDADAALRALVARARDRVTGAFDG